MQFASPATKALFANITYRLGNSVGKYKNITEREKQMYHRIQKLLAIISYIPCIFEISKVDPILNQRVNNK